MIRQLYNVENKIKREGVTIEFLQVSKLYYEGSVVNLDLSDMEPQVVADGKIKTHGQPLEVELDTGEFLVAVSRVKLSRKSSEAHVRIQLFNADEQGLPVQVFTGYFGDVAGRKGANFWRFPVVEAAMTLHSTIFDAGGAPA